MELVLKQVRERCGYTQKQLADELGVKVATYRTWEQGSVKLTLENAFNIANVLGCTPNDLCDWYATHPRERPCQAHLDPEREALLANYDRCTPERRDMLMQQAMDGAYISQERPERGLPTPGRRR
ncbi:helix-turn-helix transcriptional regulator [uncultured Parolsenella sp.]|uniref:helix-turn-helix transcriptional regulator n=1 Tax=uncultured Parolsenella sp. TaxID=2083008 RepID=UPI0025FF628A|nr:helix-turn-helix transcriptional regulator [uncultured Parolsenella sp.]